MDTNINDVIDLSDSYTLVDHGRLANVLIELDTDDSVIIDPDDSIVELSYSDTSNSSTLTIHSSAHTTKKSKINKEHTPRVQIQQKQKTALQNRDLINKIVAKERRSKIGDCPICFDPLGQNPLASTKCGHVYCMKCLQQNLSVDRRCPTCRQSLKGKTPYHPLYLNR